MTLRIVHLDGDEAGDNAHKPTESDLSEASLQGPPLPPDEGDEKPGRPAVLYVNETRWEDSHGSPRGAVDVLDPPRRRGPWGEAVPEPWEFLPSPRRKPGPFEKWPRVSHASVAAIAALIILAVSLLQWNLGGFNGAASGASVYGRGEWWRLLSALFAHGNFGHFGSNILPFLFFGWMLKAYFGWFMFPVFALVVGLVSNAVTVALYPPQVQLLGASGMIYGMIALWLVLYLRFEKGRKFSLKMARALGFAMLMLLPSEYNPQVSHLAHASGFVAGLAGGVIVTPFVNLRDPS